MLRGLAPGAGDSGPRVSTLFLTWCLGLSMRDGRWENLAPEYLFHAGRFLVERIGKRPQTSYPLGGDLIGDLEQDEISCGAAATSDSLVQLES